MAKVTSRTLRHYDRIGLLVPAWTGNNGYRYYEQEQLLRLQRILLLRELGLGLNQVAEIVDARHDQVAALRQHHKWLLREQERYARLAATVSETISQLEGGNEMAADRLFEGFDVDSERQKEYEAYLRARFGEGVQEHLDESKGRMRDWSDQQKSEFLAEWPAILRRVAELAEAGVAVTEERALDVLAGHYAFVCKAWTPNKHSYRGLGEMYADTEEFRSQIEAVRPGLAEYLRDAMAAYAEARLS
ncbi:MerR family transcriptional regulator [Kutzneria viridogrisea]|nr:DNA-binding transcriptional MerR regulator [Kutzneria viridogrisea]